LQRVLGGFAFAACGGGLAACALVSGLKNYEAVERDSGATTTRDARADAPATSDDDSPADDASEDAMQDAPSTDDATVDAPGDGADDAPGDDTGVGEAGAADAGDAQPTVDASDGGGGAPDASDGGCKPVVHGNGLGQFYSDCAPLGTYNETEAAKACAAANQGACMANTALCGAGADMECTTSANTCLCWTYLGANAGRARVSGAGVICQCPVASDPLWN
jgi:hypothetical protein